MTKQEKKQLTEKQLREFILQQENPQEFILDTIKLYLKRKNNFKN